LPADTAASGLPFLDQIDGDAHRGILLAAHGAGHGLVHLRPLPRRGGPTGGRRTRPRRLGLRTQNLLAADQDGGAIGVMTQEFKHGGQRYRRTVVAAHAIHREGDRHRLSDLPGLFM
jgi:hypothetical protein